ncbi:molybdenum cofactor guanylyltransferase [Alteribacter lacisalsi]|uniref:Probable molybdenum cofactor guanylyltransferase n=1 Tax=Alteribacter lacisalsi TaxID=2045244 RepID=A0A2W0HJB1_9BACI|nr:molybdenum cofactor guanylyltransferase [Alteribacter lacisalsi]PYZ97112.1 molybdenum cofactor guanylyltransferase [Alteribacter lacisalsi]
MKVTAVILAGGQSSRMGKNKALLSINGLPVIERIKNVLSQSCCGMLVVANSPEQYRFLHVPVVPDRFPDSGPLAGIHAGILESGCEWHFVAACDVPLISRDVIEILLREMEDNPETDVILPKAGGRLQPMTALYRRSVLPAVEEALKSGQLKLLDALNGLDLIYVDEQKAAAQGMDPERWEQSFFNMNRPEEYSEVLRIFSAGGY